jgi:hypothetical protein
LKTVSNPSLAKQLWKDQFQLHTKIVKLQRKQESLLEEFIDRVVSELSEDEALKEVNEVYWTSERAATELEDCLCFKSYKFDPLPREQLFWCGVCHKTFSFEYTSWEDFKEDERQFDDGLMIGCPACIEKKRGEISFLKSMPYGQYLQTDHWQSVRREALERAGHKCQLKESHGGILDVHHRTYKNRGAERPEDVIVLCRSCHARHHIKEVES